jgi:hypothetical protein
MMQLDPRLEPLSSLLGTWRGVGKGSYPTIADFAYTEEITFSHVGKPYLIYGQRTRCADTGKPLHTESGYWRPVGSSGLEVLIVHPTGVMELLVGDNIDGIMNLASTSVVVAPSAKPVTEVRRRFEVEIDRIQYDLSMAAVGHPLTHHLSARLERVPTTL